MPTCFIPRCSSGYKKTVKENRDKGIPNPKLYNPPKDPKIFALWVSKIPRSDKQLKLTDAVCELHFPEEDIIKFNETKLPDGTVDRRPRDNFRLRKGAVPLIFPNCPSYLSSLKTKRKAPKERCNLPTLSNKRRRISTDLPSQANIPQQVQDEEVHNLNILPLLQVENFNFEVPLPPPWSRTSAENKWIFMKWLGNKLDRHFVIDNSYYAKFFVRNKEILLQKFVGLKVSSAEILLEVIHSLSEVRICPTLLEKDDE